jgi:hypothetical protein
MGRNGLQGWILSLLTLPLYLYLLVLRLLLEHHSALFGLRRSGSRGEDGSVLLSDGLCNVALRMRAFSLAAVILIEAHFMLFCQEKFNKLTVRC